MDAETYNRLEREIAMSMRRRRSYDSNNGIDFVDRPLERSRDYEIWVYPDEIYPYNNYEINNNVDFNFNYCNDTEKEKMNTSQDNPETQNTNIGMEIDLSDYSDKSNKFEEVRKNKEE
jgi:hypothetical protein